MKRIVVFGSTGSIGRGVLSVVRRYPGCFRVVGLSGSTQAALLARQAAEFQPEAIALSGAARPPARAARRGGPVFLHGVEGLRRLAGWPGVDLVVLAIPGSDSLFPAVWSLEAGRNLALASKEALVMAGDILLDRAAAAGVRIIPLDSEHNAIFQILESFPGRPLKKIYLTASGGPFWGGRRPRRASPVSVLAHPVWKMGRKVTVDSATMFNKALEVIEARYLFNLPPERIGVLVHPQVAVHGLVEFLDGFTIACLSPPDMRFALAAGLFWPDRPPFSPLSAGLELAGRDYAFRRPSPRRFPALALAYEALNRGGACPAVFSAANEEAVNAFLAGELAFERIFPVVSRVLREQPGIARPDLDEIVAAAAAARAAARRLVAGRPA